MNSEKHLNHLLSRRSVRNFKKEPVSRETLTRLFEAAISAPSNSNRQPWRFSVIETPEKKNEIVEAVRAQVQRIKKVIEQGHHANDYGNYGDFFFEPLEAASVIVIPQYRDYQDLIASLIASGGGNPKDYHTASEMQAELCSTSAAVMALLLQAHSEGLGGCWMAGPTVARDDISKMLGIREPWRMLGAIALGYPVSPESPKPRKGIDQVVQWF